MRQWARPDMDLNAAGVPAQRMPALTDLVDELEDEEMRLAISLLYFGGGSPTIASVAADMNIPSHRVKGLTARGIQELRTKVLETDVVRSLPAADRRRLEAVRDALLLAGDGEDPGSVLPREAGEGDC